MTYMSRGSVSLNERVLLAFQERHTRAINAIINLDIPGELAFVYSKLDGKFCTLSTLLVKLNTYQMLYLLN